jgi:sporulation protein YlmC with PRC-barrel domain
MAAHELQLELLIGRQVVDVAGERVGRIGEVRAEQQGDEWVIVEYLVGVAALAERLSARSLFTKFMGAFGVRDRHQGYRIPWDKLDLTDLEHPRLTCTIAQLDREDLKLKADPDRERFSPDKSHPTDR